MRPETPTSNRDSNRWSATVGICVVLVTMVWLIFGQTLQHDFVNYDDDLYVYENPRVLSGITADGCKWAFTRSHAHNWHPLTTISHMLDCQIFGTKPGGHHFTNVTLHSIAVVLLFLVLRQMTGALWRSVFVAALFAIHPLHVESVAWIAERKDVLSAVFLMLTLGAYGHYARKPTVMRYLTMAILYACGLMSKAMLVTLPFVLLLLDYWPLGRFTILATTTKTARPASWWDRQSILRRLILEKLPLFALAAASSIVTILIQRHGITSFERLPLSFRIYNASLSVITYIWQLIWPSRLAPFYPLPSGRLSILVPVFAIALLVLASYKVWALRKQHPYLITGWFWFLGMLAPVIGLFQGGLQAHADRYSYLPHIGLYLIVTWAFADWAAQFSHRHLIPVGSAALAIIALGIVAWKQTGCWKNSETLWTHALAVTSRNYVAHHSLGMALLKNGKLDEAIGNFREAINIREYPRAHAGLAMALVQKGKTSEAFSNWQRCLQLQPDDVIVRKNFASALIDAGRPFEAMAQWEACLKYEPDDVGAQTYLAWALSTAPDAFTRDGTRAVQLGERALQLSFVPRIQIFRAVAAAYAETGQFSMAIRVATRGLELAMAQKNFALADDLRKDISHFESNTPLRDSRLGDSATSP